MPTGFDSKSVETEFSYKNGAQKTIASENLKNLENSLPKENNGNDLRKTKGLTVLTATLFIAGEMAGSGVLALPQAVAGTGWIGPLIILFCGCCACYCGICLGKCWSILEERWEEYRDKMRDPYPSIGERASGPKMKYLVSFCIDATVFGVCTVFLLLTSQIIRDIFVEYASFHLSLCYWIIIVAAALLPLSWVGSPADLWIVAMGALVSTGVACVLLVVAILLDLPNSYPTATYKAPEVLTFALAFSTIQFSFGGAAGFPTFQNDMKDRTKFTKAAVCGFVILLSIYLPVAISGYTVYGSDVPADVLAKVPPSILKMIISILLGGHVFCAFLIVVNTLLQECEEWFKIPNAFGWKRCLVRSVLICAIVFCAETLPHFGKVLNLIGGSTLTMTTFIFPSYFYIRLCGQKSAEWKERTLSLHEKVILYEIMAIGLIGGAMSTFFAIQDVVGNSAFCPPCYISGGESSGC